MNNRKELLELSMGSLFMKLAIPSVLGMLAVGLYNLIDAIFVGQLVSAEGVGAIVIAYNITLLNMAITMLFAMGSMSVLSRAIGQKDQETIDKLFGNVLISVSILSGILTLIVYKFATPMLAFIGADGEILNLATKYLKTISLGFVFSGLGPALNFLIRGEGQMKSAMRIMIVGMIVNIILDPIFIKGFGMGIEGAAVATIVAQLCVLCGDFIYFRSDKSIIKISRKHIKLSFDIMPQILNVGLSGLAMQIMPAIQMSIMFKVLDHYGGSNSVILMSASYRVMIFAFISLWGISQGMQPIVGANYGAGQLKRVKEAVTTFAKISLIVATIMWASFMIFPETILGWFITEEALVEIGIYKFRLFFSIFALYALIPLTIIFFQGIGKGGKAFLLVFGRQVFFFIPLIFILPLFLGELGAWIAMPLGDLLTLIMSLVFLKKEVVEMRKHPESICITA